jgi:hypothetical protein
MKYILLIMLMLSANLTFVGNAYSEEDTMEQEDFSGSEGW